MFFVFLFYFSIVFSILFFFLSFLDWDPLKSCLMMCIGIIFMSCYMSLGIHSWYSYFIILIFLSGIFSLLTYFCSLCNYNFYINYYYNFFFLFFCMICLFFFDFDYSMFYFDNNFIVIYYDFNYYYIFWIVFVLLLLLNLISYSFSGLSYMRSL
uniref:NADH dehydrogenase subunit 6 n=1 Tax=Setaria labiatopapillosa TaxID=108094 RepID=A0A4Y6I3W5_9BILA|nr:NADH dehydrogenase subunit 6 [Setaria labiatopapillosa]QDF64274.1 NADH dehydrogenase subunit 6 [Setaria labiatopapillosa]